MKKSINPGSSGGGSIGMVVGVGKDGTMKALEFVEDPTLPVQMRSKKQSLTVKGQLIEQ